MAVHRGEPGTGWPRLGQWPLRWLATGLALAALTTPAPAAPLVYVANLGSGTVSVIDAATSTVVATIPVGSDPNGIAATSDGRTVFVSNYVSDRLTRIDTTTNAVVDSIPVGAGPVGLAVSPDDTTLYVANKLSNTLSVLRVDTGAPIVTLPTGPGPNGVAVRPDGAVVYVTNSRSTSPGTVTVVDARANAVVGAIAVQHSPGRVAFSPDGSRAYVTNFNSWTVSVIDTQASTVVDTLSTWGRPAHVAVNPNGAFVYVSGLGGRVQAIDARTHDTTAAIGVEAAPYSFALLPTGAVGFATGFHAGTVSVVDVVAEAEAAVVPVGSRPFAAAVVCPGGCTDVPFTPPPTRTRTETPEVPPTHTPAPTHTPRLTFTPAPTLPPHPTSTAGPTPHVRLIASAHPVSDGRVTIDVTLETGGESIAGMQNDLVFDRFALRLPSREACVINPAIGAAAPDCAAEGSVAPCKTLTNWGQWACYDAFSPLACPDPDLDPRSRLRLILFAITNVLPIPDGLLYSCTFDVLDPTRLPAAVTMTTAIVSDPRGRRIPLSTTGATVHMAVAVHAGAAAAATGAPIAFGAGGTVDLPLDGSRPVHVARGAAGDIWFTDAGTDRIGRLAPTGALTLFRVPALSGPAGLAVDPAGSVWVALNDRNRLARLDPATGAIDEVVLPRAAQPFGVAVSADGTVWFTEIGANAIGRLTPDGTLSQFPLPTRLAAPMGVAVAADGSAWFTEHNANRIGRISADGVITEYALPVPGSAPLGITTTHAAARPSLPGRRCRGRSRDRRLRGRQRVRCGRRDARCG